MSLTAAGFRGLSSLTGHLIRRSHALPERKRAFRYPTPPTPPTPTPTPPCHPAEERRFLDATLDFVKHAKLLCELITELSACQLIFFLFLLLRPFFTFCALTVNESVDYDARSAHRRPREASTRATEQGGGK